MLNETFSMVVKHCENIRRKMEQLLPEAPQSRGFISTLFFWFENTNRGRDDYFETVTLHNGSGWKLAFSLAENYKGVNCRSSIWRGWRKSYYCSIWGWDLAKIELTVHAKTQKGAPLSNFRTRDVVVALRVCRGAFFSRPQPGKCPQQPTKKTSSNQFYMMIYLLCHSLERYHIHVRAWS